MGDQRSAAVRAADADGGSRNDGHGLTVEVLGPLTVHRDGLPIAVGPAMVRNLLAVLTLYPGQVVSREEIVDVLWGPTPPASYANLIHVYTSRLRGQLRGDAPPHPADAALVTREAGGYRLGIDVAALDRTRFDRLLAQAREAVTGGDPRRAMDRYDAALRCWRGPMLADLGPTFAQHPAVVNAHGRRVDATVEYARTCAGTGAHGEALDRLRTLAPTAPLHEGLQTELIRALAGVGDRAGALETYHRVSTRLVDEIGVGPGAQLQALYLGLLRDGGDGVDGEPVRAASQVPAAGDGAGDTAGDGAGDGADEPDTAGRAGADPPVPAAGARRRPLGLRRRGLTAVLSTVGVAVVAAAVMWAADGRGTPERPSAGAADPPPVSAGDAFTSRVHWGWGYGPLLGSTSTAEQWASAQVTGLVDTYSCAAFRMRVATTPDPEADPRKHEHPYEHGVLVSVCRDHWQVESGTSVDLYREDVEMPVSGLLRVSISPEDVVTVSYAGRTLPGRRLRGTRYTGRQVFPASYQGDQIRARMTGIRTNAAAGNPVTASVPARTGA